MELKDKTAIVVAGSRGPGLGIVEALAERCVKVTVVVRTVRALRAGRSA